MGPGAALPAGMGLTVAAGVPGWAARDERFLLAWDVLDRADELSAAAFRSGGYEVWTKADGSPVTDVDLHVEDLITTRIRAETEKWRDLVRKTGVKPE